MLKKTGGMNAIAMIENESCVLCRSADKILAQSNGNLANAQHANEGVIEGIAALCGIGEAKRKAMICAGQIGGCSIVRLRFFDKAFAVQEACHMGNCVLDRRSSLAFQNFAICGKFEIEKSVRVIKCWAQNLPAGHIFEGRANAPVAGHFACVNWVRHTNSGQRCTIGADQKDRLDQIATGFVDRERCKIRIKQ